MRQKINWRLIGIAILAVFVTALCSTIIYYQLFQRQVRKDLRITAEMLQASEPFCLPYEEIPPEVSYPSAELRITWVDADGTVLFDNDTNAAAMENHSDRPEIQSAFAEGTGEIVRKSDTMNMNTFYYAIRLENGTVLRVATEARSIFSVFVAASPMIAGILAVIIFVCVILANVLTRQLIAPVDNLAENLGNVSYIPEYKEMVPFMQTIRKQHEDILAAARSRQDFTANVSHELKTPLTAISGYAELIENHMVDQEQETHFAQEIRKNADRLVILINDIIRLSELDQGEEESGFEQLNLNTLAAERVEALQINARNSRISMDYSGEDCVLRANRDMMCELIDNLCQNAIRYNRENGTVTVRVYRNQDEIVLMVADTGIGIPKDQQERVFERFYRVDKSRSKATGGTGLGLAIVKHIVELHDARIQMDSEVGKGTTIRVIF
ncbi:MAG: ATP-binding protein [Roseburia sp.]